MRYRFTETDRRICINQNFQIFVKVAECASSDVRATTLSPHFVRLLNDPNKWVSFIAYQQLGPFISLFANPDITGIDYKNGQITVREISTISDETEISPPDVLSATFSSDSTNSDEYGVLPENTWLPEADYNDEYEYQLAMNETTVQKETMATTPAAKTTPKRGERVMDRYVLE